MYGFQIEDIFLSLSLPQLVRKECKSLKFLNKEEKL